MKSYLLHIIRNMPCEGNLEGRYIGRTESPLAESSVQRLLQLKGSCSYPAAQDFFASPSIRCVDTLKLLYPRADPEVILELAECDFGDWEGKTASELQDNPDFAAWLQNGGATAPPNGESGPVFVRRALKGFEMLVNNLMAKGLTRSVLVTHAGILTCVLAAHGIPQAKPTDWMCAPGCGYTLRLTPSLWMRDRVFEVVSTLPEGLDPEDEERQATDRARAAADTAFELGES